MEARIEPLGGTLPALNWRWDPETDILSGSFQTKPKGAGLTGSVELADPEGAIAVLDVTAGVLCGLDMVVWPEVKTLPELAAPTKHADGKVVIPSRPSRPGVASLEVDTSFTVTTNDSESIFHIRVGPKRHVEVVRAADHFLVEVDTHGGLAGFWLTGVPPFPAFEDE